MGSSSSNLAGLQTSGNGTTTVGTVQSFNTYGNGNSFTPPTLPASGRIEICNIADSVESFMGRTQSLSRLTTWINYKKEIQDPTVKSQTMLITGLIGVGKTELIRKYLLHNKQAYEHVLWICCGTPESIQTCLAKISAKIIGLHPEMETELRAPDMETRCEAIYDVIMRKKCLLLLDNAESMAQINKIYPKSIHPSWKRPTIVISSRNRDWVGIESIEVVGLEDQDCLGILKKPLGLEDHSGNMHLANKISTLLQGHPLAIQQVITAVGEMVDTFGSPEDSLTQFVSDLEAGSQDYLRKEPFDSPLDSNVFDLFVEAFDKFRSQENGSVILEYLGQMAFLGPNKMSTQFLQHLLRSDEILTPANALKMLRRFNMATLEDQVWWKIHRIVQQIKLEFMKHPEYNDLQNVAELAAQTVSRICGYITEFRQLESMECLQVNGLYLLRTLQTQDRFGSANLQYLQATLNGI